MITATQVIQYEDDEQSGLYFKGSDANYYALMLNDLIAKFNGETSLASWSPEELTVLTYRLIKILRSPLADKKPTVAHLKSWKECLEQ